MFQSPFGSMSNPMEHQTQAFNQAQQLGQILNSFQPAPYLQALQANAPNPTQSLGNAPQVVGMLAPSLPPAKPMQQAPMPQQSYVPLNTMMSQIGMGFPQGGGFNPGGYFG